MSVIDTLITDRTQADVDALIEQLKAGENPSEDHKGAYNDSDLNRVGNAIEYISGRFLGIGIAAGSNQKTNWESPEIVTIERMELYLKSIIEMREKLLDYRQNKKLPDSIRLLDYEGANQIESLLVVAENVVQNILLSYRGYSGRLLAGVNCLP